MAAERRDDERVRQLQAEQVDRQVDLLAHDAVHAVGRERPVAPGPLVLVQRPLPAGAVEHERPHAFGVVLRGRFLQQVDVDDVQRLVDALAGQGQRLAVGFLGHLGEGVGREGGGGDAGAGELEEASARGGRSGILNLGHGAFLSGWGGHRDWRRLADDAVKEVPRAQEWFPCAGAQRTSDRALCSCRAATCPPGAQGVAKHLRAPAIRGQSPGSRTLRWDEAFSATASCAESCPSSRLRCRASRRRRWTSESCRAPRSPATIVARCRSCR